MHDRKDATPPPNRRLSPQAIRPAQANDRCTRDNPRHDGLNDGYRFHPRSRDARATDAEGGSPAPMSSVDVRHGTVQLQELELLLVCLRLHAE